MLSISEIPYSFINCLVFHITSGSIIAEYTDEEKLITNISDWRYFDLITEINDDVEDIFEDQLTINGNLFNILIHEDGLDSAEDQVYEVLTEFYESSNERFRMTNDYSKFNIMKWTANYYYDTAELLFKNSKKIRKKPLTNKSGLYYFLEVEQ